ncbi:MAG: hypothetical protein J5689_03440, partial [Clostridia bacterium]|nr:hypothetical protein [Clostridia bacterium]
IEVYNINLAYIIVIATIIVSALSLNESKILLLSLLMAIGVCLENASISGFSIILVWAFTAIILKNTNKYIISLSILIADILLGTVFNAYIT